VVQNQSKLKMIKPNKYYG